MSRAFIPNPPRSTTFSSGHTISNRVHWLICPIPPPTDRIASHDLSEALTGDHNPHTNPTKQITSKPQIDHHGNLQLRYCGRTIRILCHTNCLKHSTLSAIGSQPVHQPLCATVLELQTAMCRLIKIVHFGCDENHSEVVLTRCKAALEYVLDMPFKEVCRGMVEVEDWVMSPCRFCKEYSENQKARRAVGGHGRAISLQEDELPCIKDSLMTVSTFDKPAMLKAKKSFESTLCTRP